MIQQSKKKASPCKIILKADKEQDKQKKLEAKKLNQTGPNEPSKGELKVTEKKEMAEDDPAYAETPILQ